MPEYVTLWEYTPQGVENIAQSPERVDEVEEIFESVGGDLKEFYLLMGQYDTLIISEFPDDETATRAILSVVQEGYVKSQTLEATSREEFRELSEEIP